MPLISKESWEKLTQEEKDKIGDLYDNVVRKKNNASLSESNKTIFGYSCLIEVLDKLFGNEQLQSQPLTYEDVARELFEGKDVFYIDENGEIENIFLPKEHKSYLELNNCTSRKQAEKLLAINKLLNVAKFLNKDWKPDGTEGKLWTLGIEKYKGAIMPVEVGAYDWRTEIVYFRTEELARQAVEILGEDVIRTALSTEW